MTLNSVLNRLLGSAAAAVLALALAAPAAAVTIDEGLTPNVLNTVEDQDREAFIDVDGDGTLSVGDVFIGYVRIDDFLPSGDSADNQVYAVFSNQIIGFDGNMVILGATTTAGLTLQDITGDANTAGGMFAVYDSGSSMGNLITNPGAVATDLEGVINHILAEGTLRLVAGIDGATDDYFVVTLSSPFTPGMSTDLFAATPVSVTVGSFVGGLSILYNNTSFDYADDVLTVNPQTGMFVESELGIGNGAIRGAIGDGNEAIFTDASGYTNLNQCTVNGDNVICGFVTDADFFVRPLQVAEPGSVALMGIALLGLFGLRRRLTKNV
jgi:hypothetical protein